MLDIVERNKLKMELYKNGVSVERQREIIRMLEADEEQRFLLDVRSEYGNEDLWVLIFRSYVYGVKIEKMDKFKETRLKTQIEYIDGLINDLDKSYDDRGNDYDLHFMFGRAIGGLKGIRRTLNNIIEEENG